MRLRVLDRCGLTRGELARPVIWTFWHNRILMIPVTRARFCSQREATVITSASKDGDILAAVMARFGVKSVRGSSSRRGGIALRELVSAMKAGHDIGITPDGPRGPVYHLNPGVIKLAQMTQYAVMPVFVEYSNCWQLRSWDGFRIPKPFSSVTVTFGALYEIAKTSTDADFEAERVKLEELLRNGEAAPASV